MVFLLVPQDLALPWLSCAGANSWVSFSILLVTTWMGPCSRMGPFCSAWSWVSQNNICLSVPCGDVIYDQPSPKSGMLIMRKRLGIHTHGLHMMKLSKRTFHRGPPTAHVTEDTCLLGLKATSRQIGNFSLSYRHSLHMALASPLTTPFPRQPEYNRALGIPRAHGHSSSLVPLPGAQ